MTTDGQNDAPTTDPPATDPPANDPPANVPPEHHHDDDACRGRHTALTERVDALESALNAVVQFKPDSTPVKKPWTHRGGK